MGDLGFNTLLYTTLSAQGSSLKGHIQETLASFPTMAAHPEPRQCVLHGLPPAALVNLHLQF